MAWLKGSWIALDSKNFIPMGSDVPFSGCRSNDGYGRPWPLETSVRGVFYLRRAVRSVKRVGAAIGEGAVVGAQLHTALANGQAATVREARGDGG